MMGAQRVISLDDPRVGPYRNLKDRELARDGDRFIAEGEHLLRRLLASDFAVDSVLLAERRAEEWLASIPEATTIYIAPDALLHEIIGYKFHSGVIACGRRKPAIALEQIASRPGPLSLVICPEIANAENLGTLVRISAALGADAMLLGERCCDPFWRQSVRVSMGSVFTLPIIQSRNILLDLQHLRQTWDVELAATVIAPTAEPLDQVRLRPRRGILFGNEAQGLSDEQTRACDRQITIPMHAGTDSLNVSVAAGIFLYHFLRDRQPSAEDPQ